ncbi:MAG: RdgB/HAM1 family non-canonical purine NTP pyrophosphatase [Acidobacteriota bacterium]|nr:RdgB/HAM1 family non-canonical purine NTP pyrophosphatase [Acidobacteriota bacterium]
MAAVKLVLATSNPGKLREYRVLSGPSDEIALDLLPDFSSLPSFEETAPTFAENAAGKALHYSRFTDDPLLAEDSGLVVPALGGAPGPLSARWAGPDANDADRVRKLLDEMKDRPMSERGARFLSVAALARRGEAVAIFSDFVEGVLTRAPQGAGGFGYDPIFLFEPLGRTFAEVTVEEKNLYSHRARAFRKVAAFLRSREKGLLL